MSGNAYALMGLTAIVGALVGTVTFALLRLGSAARETSRRNKPAASQALLSGALEDALFALKAQERATAARADASERLSGEIIASLSAGLLVVGLDGQVRILNPAGRRLLDVPDGETPQNYRILIDEPALLGAIDACLGTGTPVLRRTVHLPERGARASRLGVTVSPLFDGQSKLHGAICLFTDLTAVQQLEEQLRLKESLARVGELTAGIAHEFRNGLATIHGYGKLLDPAALPDGFRPYVEGIRAETESLGQIVTNFLNFARPAQLTLTAVDLKAICERAVDEVRAEARALGGDISVRGEFGQLQGDEVLLRQAVSNLLRNAVEACFEASVAPVIVIQGDVDPAHQMCRVTVNDSGPGIQSVDRERIFQPFVTSKRNGTGLGLALVQKIIVYHNGRIAAGDSPLGGASLQVTLPLAA